MSDHLYVTRPRALIVGDDEGWEQPSDTAREVIESDGDYAATGLVDHHGRPLYRKRARVSIGFHGRSKE
jgi:predicted amidohydrolase YtcJ